MRLQDQLYAEQQRVADELSRRVDPASVQRRLEALSNAVRAGHIAQVLTIIMISSRNIREVRT